MTIYERFKKVFNEYLEVLNTEEIKKDNTYYVAMAYGDLLLKQLNFDPSSRDSDLIKQFIEDRKDYLTSDKEIVALGLTMTYFH